MATTKQYIILSPEPRGHFIEGTLASGQTPKPGQVLELTSDGTYQVFSGADGATGELVITVEDSLQGQTVDDAYADGAHFFGYIPGNGDVLQMLLKNISGTSDAFSIGDKLSVNQSTGKLIAATGNRSPFTLLEAVAALTADELHMVRVNLN